jgi:hypothetical protein
MPNPDVIRPRCLREHQAYAPGRGPNAHYNLGKQIGGIPSHVLAGDLLGLLFGDDLAKNFHLEVRWPRGS